MTSWTQTVDTASLAVFASSEGVTVTIDKSDPAVFSLKIEGPFALLSNVIGPLGIVTSPGELVASWVEDRESSGESVT